MTIEPRGERLPQPRHEVHRPRMTHERLDDALLTSIEYGIDAARIVEAGKDQLEVLSSAIDIVRHNNLAESLTPILAEQWVHRASHGKISSFIPDQDPPIVAPANAITASLERGETLTGVIAAAGRLESGLRAKGVFGVLRRRDGQSHDARRLNAVVNGLIEESFGHSFRQRTGAAGAPLLWGRALHLLRHADAKTTHHLLLPVGLGLEQSIALNANMWSQYPDALKSMAIKVTESRNIARTADLPKRIKDDIESRGFDHLGRRAAERSARHDIQIALLKEALYGRGRFIPRPRRPQ